MLTIADRITQAAQHYMQNGMSFEDAIYHACDEASRWLGLSDEYTADLYARIVEGTNMGELHAFITALVGGTHE
jgi:hypothetical protein